MRKICTLLLLCLQPQGAFAIAAVAGENLVVTLADDVEISVDRFPSRGEYLLVWLAPEYGFRPAHRSLAAGLSGQDIEVWQSDIVESLFLPQGTASLKQLDGRYIADLIEYAHRVTGKKIAIVGDSYAAASALLGAHQWQRRDRADRYFVGAILFSPYTYARIPPLGQPPEYLPIVESTNIPLLIYQGQHNATAGQFEQLLEKLRINGSPVYTRSVPGIMSLFYNAEPTSAMIAAATPIPSSIRQMLPIMEGHGVPARPVSLMQAPGVASGIDIYLKDYTAASRPAAITLTNIDGDTVVRDSFAGKLTVVNFWATWCPPCIEEIPSLNRLQQKMQGRAFELISINYAEDRETVMRFMKRVRVEFPVLLDSKGDTARQWGVISYPSTFVIDSEGFIRYGVNAAIEWDSPELIRKLELLMQ